MSKSSKQKLNTKSSTEAELVGASDYLPHAIWAKKFMEAQGYAMKESRFYQDNQSTIRFEKNGRRSCGPNSRHIDIRYFFIKDRLERDSFDVQYCPTEQMLADFFTKPLQGSLFRRLRAVVMGHKHVDTLREATSDTPQERVGDHVVPKRNGDVADVRKADGVSNKSSITHVPRQGSSRGVDSPTPVAVDVRPTKRDTYAEVVKRRDTYAEVVKRRVRFDLERSEINTPLTIKK